MIALCGGTGRVGGEVARLLEDGGVRFKVMTRRHVNGRSASSLDGPEAVTIDFGEASTLETALKGVDRLFVGIGTSPDQVKSEIALLDAAARVGVGHVVKLSTAGARQGRPMVVLAWHTAIEEHLERLGLAASVLRPTTFTDVLQRSLSSIAAGSWGGATGSGRVNLIDSRDVAAAACAVLIDGPALHAGRTYELTGPEALSMRDIADRIGHILHRPVPYEVLSAEDQRARLKASGVAELYVEILVGLDHIVSEGWFAETTTSVMVLTGKEPRPVDDWLREHLEESSIQ